MREEDEKRKRKKTSTSKSDEKETPEGEAEEDTEKTDEEKEKEKEEEEEEEEQAQAVSQALVEAFEYMNNIMKEDNAKGLTWVYNNADHKRTFQEGRAYNRGVSCARFVIWAYLLIEPPIVPSNIDFWGSYGLIKGGTNETELAKYFYIWKFPKGSQNLDNLTKGGYMRPGDVVMYWTQQHTNAYHGYDAQRRDYCMWDGGHAGCGGGSGDGVPFKDWKVVRPYWHDSVSVVMRSKKSSGKFIPGSVPYLGGLGSGFGSYTATIDFLTPDFFLLDQEHDNSVDPPGMGSSDVAKANTDHDGKASVSDGSDQGSGQGTPGLDALIERLKEYLEWRYDASWEDAIGELHDFLGKDSDKLPLDQFVDSLQKYLERQGKTLSEVEEDLLDRLKDAANSTPQSLQDALDSLGQYFNKPGTVPGPEAGAQPLEPKPPSGNWGHEPEEKPEEPEEEEPGGSNWGPSKPGENKPEEEEPQGPVKMRRRILLECNKFEERIKDDRILGKMWRYEISDTFHTMSLDDMIQSGNNKCNGYMFVNWMLQNIKVLKKEDNIFYNDGSKLVFSTPEVETDLYNGCEFLKIDGTAKLIELQESGIVIPGDIVCIQGIRSLQIYSGNQMWFDGGPIRCIAGYYLWINGRPTYPDQYVYGILRLKEEEVEVTE